MDLSLNMRVIIALLIVAGVAESADNDILWEPGLRVKYGRNTSTSFYDMPRNVTQAIAKGMIEATPPIVSEGPLSQLKMYLVDKYGYLCVLFDDTESVAGLQIGFPESEMTGGVFNYTVQGFTNWTVEIDGVETTLVVTHIYFISEEELAIDPEIRIAKHNSNKTLQYGGAWVTGFYGKLYFIPETTAEELAKTIYTEQACYPGMGLHYFYNITVNTPCTEDYILPWCFMMNSNQLVGISFMTPGDINVKTGATKYFEAPTFDGAKSVVIHGPECFTALVQSPGLTSQHIYFVEDPWNIPCS